MILTELVDLLDFLFFFSSSSLLLLFFLSSSLSSPSLHSLENGTK